MRIVFALVVLVLTTPIVSAQVRVDFDEDIAQFALSSRSTSYLPLIFDVHSESKRAEVVNITIRPASRQFSFLTEEEHVLKAGESLHFEFSVAAAGHYLVSVEGEREAVEHSHYYTARFRRSHHHGRRRYRGPMSSAGPASSGPELNLLRITQLIAGPNHGTLGRFSINQHAMGPQFAFRRWTNYLGCDVVAIDKGSFDLIDPAAKRALAHWVETGGCLICDGFEDDSVRPFAGFWPDGAPHTSLPCAARLGLGRVALAGKFEGLSQSARATTKGVARIPGEAVRDGGINSRLERYSEALELMTEGESDARLDAEQRIDPGRRVSHWGRQNLPLVKGLGGSSPRRFAFFVVIFAILVGPVNLWYLSKKNKRVWALFTIPALSLLAFFGLIIFAIISEGLNVRTLPRTFEHLDQSRQRSALIADVGIYSGMSLGANFRLRGDAAAVPTHHNPNSYRRAERGLVPDGGTRLTGDWLQPRTPKFLKIMRSELCRQRLTLAEDQDQALMTNGLSSDIVHLVWRNADGQYFEVKNLGAGEQKNGSRLDIRAFLRTDRSGTPPTVPLQIQRETPRSDARSFLNFPKLGYFAKLEPNQYFARLNAPIDDIVIHDDIESMKGIHFLRGSF